jgi:hypothetical protein
MKIGEFRFLEGKRGIIKARQGYALIFGDAERFAFVSGYFTRHQAKKEL